MVMTLLNDILEKEPRNVVGFIENWLFTSGQQFNQEHLKRKEELPSSDSDEEMDEEEEKQMARKSQDQARKTTKKFAISAEAYGDYNKMDDFVPKIVEKTDEQKKQIIDTLKESFMFSSLEGKALEIVIDAMEIRSFQPGDSVIKQGDDGQELFVVFDGTLECTKQMEPQGEPKFLKNYKSGDVFGELALMYNAPRAATITAKEESTCFCLDRDTFNAIVK